MKRLAMTAVVVFLACGPSEANVEVEADSVGTAAALGSEVAVTFFRNWTVGQQGGLLVGNTLRVIYDEQRLPQCREEQGGQPLWSITGYWRMGTESGEFEAGGRSASGGAVSPLIPLTRAGELELWFQVRNRSGCVAWDSAYGHNYRLQVMSPGPTVRFHAGDWRMEQTGPTRGASNIIFEYDPERLPNCRQGYNGLPTWDILMWYRFDGGAISYFPTTRATGYTRVMNPVALSVPPGAKRLEVWFKGNDRAGCVQWDSRYGSNYAFDL